MASLTKPLEFKSLQKSKEKCLVALLGQQKHGKTMAMLSASKKFDPTFAKPQVLDDIAMITVEPDAMRGPKLLGVEVPYWLDLTDYTDQGAANFDEALKQACSMVKQLAEAGKIEAYGVDTISTLDKTWTSYLSKQFEKWDLTRAVMVKHRQFVVEKLLPIPAPGILSLHTKVLSSGMDAEKKATLGLDVADKVAMDLSGWDTPGFYRAQASYILPIKKHEAKGKPDEFFLYPKGVDGIEAGGRYGAGGPPERLPANMRAFFQIIGVS